MTERKVTEQKGPNFETAVKEAMKKLSNEKQSEKKGGKKSG